MDLGKIAIGAGLGAASGYFNNNVKQSDSKKLAAQEERKAQLLAKRDATLASYESNRDKAKAGYDSKAAEAKAKSDLNLESERSKNAIALEATKKSGSNGGYSAKEIDKLDIAIHKEHAKHVATEAAAFNEPMSYNDYVLKFYPNQAKRLGVTKTEETGEPTITNDAISRFLRVADEGGNENVSTNTVVGDLPSTGKSVVEEPAPIVLPTNTTDTEGDKTIKADKKKIMVDAEKIKVAAEQAISSLEVKDKPLQSSLGKLVIAIREGDDAKIYEWKDKIEAMLEKIQGGKFLKEIRSMGKTFQKDNKE